MTDHPPTGDPALKTPARRKLRALVAAQQLPCMAPNCKHPGVPIDYRPRRRGQAYNPLAYELDEIVPRTLGGRPDDPDNVRPVHAACNRAGGGMITTARQRGQTILINTSPINSGGMINNAPHLLVADDW